MLRLYDIAYVWRNAYRYQRAISLRISPPSSVFSDVSESSTQAVLNALQATNRPSEVLRFLQGPDATEKDIEAFQQLVVSRLDHLAQGLVAFSSASAESGTPQSFKPWHQSVAMTLEAAAIQMEVQAVPLIVSRELKLITRSFRMTQWELLLDQVAGIMRQMEGSGKYTISSFCGTLVKSISGISSQRKVALARQRRDRANPPTVPVVGQQLGLDDQSTNFTLDWLLQNYSQMATQPDGQFGDASMGDGLNDPILQMLLGEQTSGM